MGAMKQALLELKDIHLPEPLPWWDLAMGWWLLLLSLLLLSAVAFYGLPRLMKYYRRQKQRKALRQEISLALEDIRTAYQQDKDSHALVCRLSTFLRRVCLTLFKDKAIAGLVGEKWLLFLDELWVGEKPKLSFSQQCILRLLEHAVYATELDVDQYEDAKTLLALSELWSQEVIKHYV